jgi:hypothetical protein
MNHDSCGIDDPAKPGLNLKVDLFLKEREELLKGKEGFIQSGKVVPIQNLFAQPTQPPADGFHHYGSGMDLQEVEHLLVREDFIHTRYFTKNLLAKGRRHLLHLIEN